MAQIITFEYVKKLLDKPKINFIDFQAILFYLYDKLDIIINCNLKKHIMLRDISLIKHVIATLEVKVYNNEIEEPNLKQLMKELLNEFKEKMGHGIRLKGVVV